MKDYRHMMEQVTLSDQKKEDIMDMLENKGTQKRRGPSVKMLVLAAALAVGCVLSIAAGLPTQVYNFFSGGTLTITTAGGGAIGGAEMVVGGDMDVPIISEDGRLWFIDGEERIDVTDLIDEDTPYIHEHTDPATGNKGYVILGGTVDDFGWAEFAVMDGDLGGIIGENFSDALVTLPDGSKVSFFDLTEEQREALNSTNGPGEDGGIQGDYVIRPWYEAALEQLGFEG